MKRLLAFSLCMAFVFSLQANTCLETAGNTTTTKLESIYRIQIGAYSKPTVEQFKGLTKIGYIYQEIGTKNVKRIFMGQFMDKSVAKGILAQVHAAGFEDAFIDQINLAATDMTYLVQLGAYELIEIEWEKFKAIDNLYMQFAGEKVKLLSGTFYDLTQVNKELKRLKEKGFNGVFIKHTNKALVHKVTPFEIICNNAQSKLVVVDNGKIEKKTEKPAPKPQIKVAVEDKEPIKGSLFSAKEKPTFNPTEAPKEFKINDFSNVNRKSVAGLQKALQEGASYKGQVSGEFNKNTNEALVAYASKNSQYTTYKNVAAQPKPEIGIKGGMVQMQIDLIGTDAKTVGKKLERIKEPLAKAYLAYLYFTDKVVIDKSQKHHKVNQLMNDAIGETYLDRQYKGVAKIDFYKTYMYDDIETLILHIGYLQDASEDELAIPCWMIEEHPNATGAMLRELQLPLTSKCGDFMDWTEIRVLKEAAAALDPIPEYKKGDGARMEIQMYAARRSQLYITPAISSEDEAALIEKWEELLWSSIEKNRTKAPKGEKTITPFKVAYYQAFVKLENHYLGRGFQPDEARLFALDVLRSVVNYHLSPYLVMN